MDSWDSRTCVSTSFIDEPRETSRYPIHPQLRGRGAQNMNTIPPQVQSSSYPVSSINAGPHPDGRRAGDVRNQTHMYASNKPTGSVNTVPLPFGEDIKRLDRTEFSDGQKDYFFNLFQQMNENGCGYLNFLEFRACLVEFGMAHLTNLMVKQILDNVNGNGTKMVDFGEFLNMWERAAEKDQTLPFSDDLYHALKRMDMLPTKPAPVPFERAKNFFETKTCQMTWEAVQERQQQLMRRARLDVAGRLN